MLLTCVQCDACLLRRTGDNETTLRTFIRTTCAMVVVPLVVILSASIMLDKMYAALPASDKMLYAGIAGIVSVQLVVLVFLAHAFTERVGEEKDTKVE